MDLPPPPSPGPLAFRDPHDALLGIEPETTARLLSSANDLTLVIDSGGIIRDIAVGSNDLGTDPFAHWIDQPFVETVSSESRQKVEEMLRDVTHRSTPRWRQVNHPGPDGNLAVKYLAMEAGADGRVIAVGREMRGTANLQQRLIQAQQSMERDYVRLRQTEQRYRLLFDLSDEAVLMVDGRTRLVAEANPAAIALFGDRGASLVGQAFPGLFLPADRDDLLQHLGALVGGATERPCRFHLADSRPVRLAATLFRQDRGAQLLVRLRPGDGEVAVSDPRNAMLSDVLERIPDAFVLADRKLVIRAVNTAFLDLTHLPHAEQAIGEPLGRFLGRPEIDMDLMLGQLRTEAVIRNFETRLATVLGDLDDVEVSAVVVDRHDEVHYGFAIRPIARRLGRMDLMAADEGAPRSVEQLTELVGRVPLKDIVRESTDLIERLCIEAALRYTSNNRASAAEILGLSRQSLYSKLHRHGIANPAGEGEDIANRG